jgi:hypothetical protein
MKSNSNSFGPGSSMGAANAATPLITSGKPPHEHHWWYLV